MLQPRLQPCQILPRHAQELSVSLPDSKPRQLVKLHPRICSWALGSLAAAPINLRWFPPGMNHISCRVRNSPSSATCSSHLPPLLFRPALTSMSFPRRFGQFLRRVDTQRARHGLPPATSLAQHKSFQEAASKVSLSFRRSFSLGSPPLALALLAFAAVDKDARQPDTAQVREGRPAAGRVDATYHTSGK